MTILTVGAAGRLTSPKEVICHLGVGPSDEIEVTPQPDGIVLLRRAGGGGTTKHRDGDQT